MEASQPQRQQEGRDPITAEPEVIQQHLSDGTPLPPETARRIYLLNTVIKRYDPEIAWDGDW